MKQKDSLPKNTLSSSTLSANKNQEVCQVFTYEITNEPIDKEFAKLPNSIQDELNTILARLKSSSTLPNAAQMISRLEKLEKQYPNVLTFSNYLTIIYQKTDEAKFEQFVRETYEKHPDYLFARLNYAEQCLKKGQLEKVLEIFKEGFELKLLYPQRNCFHLSEFTCFFSFVYRYYLYAGKYQQAEMILQNLEQVAPDHPKVKQLASFTALARQQSLLSQNASKKKSSRFKA